VPLARWEISVSDYFVDNCLVGKVAFFAGGSSGINLGIASRFADKGARVTLISRAEERLVAAAKSIADRGGCASWAVADVRDPEAVRAALQRCAAENGPIDILVSGAAGNFLAPVSGLSSNGFKTVVDIDLLGTYNVLKHSYEFLRKPGASLISISAPQAEKPMSGQAHACAAKAGINMLTMVLAKEWGGEGIRVNAISPGFIAETEGTARLVDTDQKAAALLDAIPLRRLGRKDEIADLALFLSSDNAQYVTGAIFDCDGGYSLGTG
jgi:NAD(P)-dependent dehydrogenase (short-subunit alcohol dehydrogenase family)